MITVAFCHWSCPVAGPLTSRCPSAQPWQVAWLRLAVVTACLGFWSMETTSAQETPAQEPAVEYPLPDGVHPSHPLVPALQRVYAAREAVSQLKDYEAVFLKREVLGGKLLKTTTQLKVREEPFSVYMKFVEPNKGREVLFVNGRNDGKLLVHETGFKSLVGTLALDIKSRDVMSENRYPVTMVGLNNLVTTIIKQWEAEAKYGEVDVLYRPKNRLGEQECEVIETSHPKKRNQFPFQLTRVWIDTATNWVIRVEQFDFPAAQGGEPPLAEEYTYVRIKPNVGLTDRDFDKRNPAYEFP
jgi:hypothetical protein